MSCLCGKEDDMEVGKTVTFVTNKKISNLLQVQLVRKTPKVPVKADSYVVLFPEY